MRRIFGFLIVFAGLSAAPAAVAHHSFAVHYLPDKIIALTGVVDEFRFTNPHGIVHFKVRTPEGEEQEWRAETNSPSLLRRRGWTKDSIKIGDRITVTGWPARDGTNLLRIGKITLPDGSELIGQSIRAGSENDKD
jgi:Family of unknown function (DUF6152)